MNPKKIALVAAEVAPFAKTGGLADVVAGLGRALVRAGHEVRVITPLHGVTARAGYDLRPVEGLSEIPVALGARTPTVAVRAASHPSGDLDVLFVDHPESFDRPSVYTDSADEALRFALLCRAALTILQWLSWSPDVIHGNDWHTGLLPLECKTRFAWDRIFQSTRTLFTIHNLAYQGIFPQEVLDTIGLGAERHLLHAGDLREGRVNFLRTGILHADALTTVSESYAREIQSRGVGMGLDDTLRDRNPDLFGICNGVDYGTWDPAADPYIPHPYGPGDPGGKSPNRAALLARMNLDSSGDPPVLGSISRLTLQKGLELLLEVAPALLARDGCRLVVLGEGEERYVRRLAALRERFPGRCGFVNAYDEALAHLVEAGSDLFLMPSRWEPCGLNQMFSLRYGTVPVVRRTGGLADTVEPWDSATGEGTGFLFDTFSAEAFLDAIRRALDVRRDAASWRKLVANGMSRDFSWDRQARHYGELYARLGGG